MNEKMEENKIFKLQTLLMDITQFLPVSLTKVMGPKDGLLAISTSGTIVIDIIPWFCLTYCMLKKLMRRLSLILLKESLLVCTSRTETNFFLRS